MHAENDVPVQINGSDSDDLGDFWYFVTTDFEPADNIWGNNNGTGFFTTDEPAGTGGSFNNYGNVHGRLPEVVNQAGTATRSSVVGNLLFVDTTLWVGGEQMVWSGDTSSFTIVDGVPTIDWVGYPAFVSGTDQPTLTHRAFANLDGTIYALGDGGHLFELNNAGDAFVYKDELVPLGDSS